MGRSLSEELAQQICTHKFHLIFGMAIAVFFILLSLISLTVVHPNSGAYYITIVNIVTLVCVFGVCGFAVLLCNRRGY